MSNTLNNATPAPVVPSQQILQAEICRVWNLLYRPGDVVEMRSPKCGKYRTVSGYFENPTALVKAVQEWNGQANLYMVLNPVNTALLARSANRAQPYAEVTSNDSDVPERRLQLVDFDVTRPSGISATDAEHEAALRRSDACHTWLKEAYAVETLTADSGNGGHTLVPVDLPNDDASRTLMEQFLLALAARFDDDEVHVDTGCFNAARLCKLYGTLACKGDNLPDRPHRVSRLLHVPDTLPPVPREVLAQIVSDLLPEPQQAEPNSPTPQRFGRGGEFDVTRWMAEHHLSVHRELPYKNGTRFQLETCPFNAEHKAPDAAVFRFADGHLGFKCFHKSCEGKDWQALRDLMEPGRIRREKSEVSEQRGAGKGVPSHNSLTSQAGQIPERMTTPIESPPSCLDEAAYHGLAGEIVRIIEPHTESDPAAILVQMLVAFGNVIGRSAYFPVEASRHYMNLFAVIVGQSAKARKGTSLDHVRRLFDQVDADWMGDRAQSGLSSGEGMLHAVRDPLYEVVQTKEKGKYTEETQEVLKDAGVEDKRLFITESEFARTLHVMEREGNTLSAFLRDAWDTGKLRVLTKSPQKATNAHISIGAHITRDELRRLLTSTEAANGFANRFLWVHVQRSKMLPRGGELHRVNMEPLIERLAQAVAFAQSVERMERGPQAWEAWDTVYPELTRDVPGLLGSVTSRAEAQVTRLSCLYALLDQSSIVRLPHLKAALAVWEYAEQSARYIFGDALGDAVADAILQALRSASNGLTRKEISDHFGRHHKAERLTMALHLLQERGLATFTKEETGGRPAEVWQAVTSGEASQ